MLNYIIVDSTEWTYPDYDFASYKSASDKIDIFAAKNSYATAQILLKGLPENGKLNILTLGFSAEFFELLPIYVEGNPHLNENNALPHYPERWAPYYLYDCLKPFNGTVNVMNGIGGLYMSVKTETTGNVEGGVVINGTVIPVKIKVYDVEIPDETLKIINGYSRGHVAKYHNVETGSAEFDRLDTEYLTMLRRMRQNMLYAPGPKITALGDNKYSFDFTYLKAFVTKATSLGYKYFNGASIGGRVSWHESTILVHGMPAMSYEAFCYLSQYLPAFVAFLKENGWINNFFIGVADEPNTENATEFRALCGLVRKLAPEIRYIDAMSYGNLHGALDVWVPLNAEYDKHMAEIETFRGTGDEIWHYVCCVPRQEGYINRFLDIPLLATRYLFWGNYKYDLKGYLHWAANHYQPNQDPFTQNCPLHKNADSEGILPPGDTHLIYPGEDAPWMSIRLEAQRESAEDYELLRFIARKDKQAADEMCNNMFTTFNKVEYDVIKFKENKIKMLETAVNLR
ncbi:MAG: DUF4091 domain-containing protein [Oscillospiraceae bacterium]|nr:DUF4091 domain-containing protein [Oscillospiraceae bacterium]